MEVEDDVQVQLGASAAGIGPGQTPEFEAKGGRLDATKIVSRPRS